MRGAHKYLETLWKKPPVKVCPINKRQQRKKNGGREKGERKAKIVQDRGNKAKVQSNNEGGQSHPEGMHE